MSARCKVGDLAVVVNADILNNLGNIVEILAVHDGSGDINFRTSETVWWVHCVHEMTYQFPHRGVIRRREGPVPDSRLMPIRGQERDKDTEETKELEVCS